VGMDWETEMSRDNLRRHVQNAFEPEGELVLSRSAYHYPHAPQLLVFGTDAVCPR
jgi:hypothetical protein